MTAKKASKKSRVCPRCGRIHFAITATCALYLAKKSGAR
jgi:hypothetical protein